MTGSSNFPPWTSDDPPAPDRIAQGLLRDEPAFRSSLDFGPFVHQGRGHGRAVLIGDQMGVELFSPDNIGFLDHRMAGLARPGDVVVVRNRAPDFEAYLAECLGLHALTFLEVDASSLAPAAAQCRTDPGLFNALLQALRKAGGLTLEAYLPSGHVWRLAQSLGESAGLPVHVAGPGPRVARRANDKLWFWNLARRVTGQSGVPPTYHAYGPAAAAGQAARLARQADHVVVKVPSSAGSAGNIRIDAARLRGLSLAAIRDLLESRLFAAGWRGHYPVLVGVWESGVISSPSVQIRIPHPEVGPPVIQGIFEQRVVGDEGAFVGATPAHLPQVIRTRMIHQAGQICAVLQKLGYFGPCSLDSLLRRDRTEALQLHWIECNGRWSGVSIPLAVARARCKGACPEGIAIAQEVVAELPPMDIARMRALLRDMLVTDSAGCEGLILLSPPYSERGFSFNALAIAGAQTEADRILLEARKRLGLDAVPGNRPG